MERIHAPDVEQAANRCRRLRGAGRALVRRHEDAGAVRRAPALADDEAVVDREAVRLPHVPAADLLDARRRPVVRDGDAVLEVRILAGEHAGLVDAIDPEQRTGARYRPGTAGHAIRDRDELPQGALVAVVTDAEAVFIGHAGHAVDLAGARDLLDGTDLPVDDRDDDAGRIRARGGHARHHAGAVVRARDATKVTGSRDLEQLDAGRLAVLGVGWRRGRGARGSRQVWAGDPRAQERGGARQS